MTVLRFESLSYFAQDTGKAIINQLSWQLERGSRVGLIGANGSGKSTLARIAAGILKAHEGTLITSTEAHDGDTRQRPLRIAMIFQNPDTQLLGATPREDLQFGMAHLSSEEQETCIAEVLQKVPIAELIDRENTTLSGGQKQLVAIAAALVTDHDLIIMDEPSSMLDARTTADLVSIIRQIDRDTTLLCISHDIRMLREMDSIALLHEGAIVCEAPPRELYAMDLSPYGLREPREVRLCKELAAQGRDIGIQLSADEIGRALCQN